MPQRRNIQKILTAVLAASLLLILAACSSEEPVPAPTVAPLALTTPTAPPTPTAQAETPTFAPPSLPTEAPSETPVFRPTPLPTSTLHPIFNITPTAAPTTTPLATPFYVNPVANLSTDAPENPRAFPTPDVPPGVQIPPIPPTIPADPSQLPTRTPTPTPLPVLELADDDPLSQAQWFQDGINEFEFEAIHLINFLADRTWLSIEQLLNMPALQSIEPEDINALKALVAINHLDRKALIYIFFHPTMHAGIYPQWADVIAALPGAIPEGGRTKPDPAIMGVLLDPSAVTVQRDTLSLPSGRQVKLAIIRTSTGDSASLQRLKNAVIAAENENQVPFPQSHVVVLFTQWPYDSTIGGQFHHTAISISNRFDVGYGEPDSRNADRLMTRLVSRYYPSVNPTPDQLQQQAQPQPQQTVQPTTNWGDLLPPTKTPVPKDDHHHDG